MDIIALRGNQNQGKSETLNIVYQLMLLFGYTQVSGHFRGLGNPANKDCIDILEKRGARIGIALMGDYERQLSANITPAGDTVQDLLTYLQVNGCTKAICACNNSLGHAISFIQTFNHTFVNKTVTALASEHRIKNGMDAEVIYKLV